MRVLWTKIRNSLRVGVAGSSKARKLIGGYFSLMAHWSRRHNRLYPVLTRCRDCCWRVSRSSITTVQTRHVGGDTTSDILPTRAQARGWSEIFKDGICWSSMRGITLHRSRTQERMGVSGKDAEFFNKRCLTMTSSTVVPFVTISPVVVKQPLHFLTFAQGRKEDLVAVTTSHALRNSISELRPCYFQHFGGNVSNIGNDLAEHKISPSRCVPVVVYGGADVKLSADLSEVPHTLWVWETAARPRSATYQPWHAILFVPHRHMDSEGVVEYMRKRILGAAPRHEPVGVQEGEDRDSRRA